MKLDFSLYLSFTEFEFAADEYFQQWVLANDAKNDAFWSQFLLNHPQKMDMIKKARQLVKDLVETTYYSNPLSADEKVSIKENIYKKVQNPKHNKAIIGILHKKTWLIASAVAALLFILFSIGKINSVTAVAVKEDLLTMATGIEETRSFELSDGSYVELNPNSSLRYVSDFSTHKIREVYLEGNASFQVKKDSSHKQFVVHANGTSITVLGTEFNVNARTEATEVMLNTGRVKVSQDNSQTLAAYLVPGEKIKLDTNLNIFVKSKISMYEYSVFAEHKWNFQQTSLAEITHVLSSYYGVNIMFANKQIGKMKVNALMPVTTLQSLIPILENTLHIKIKENQSQNFLFIQ